MTHLPMQTTPLHPWRTMLHEPGATLLLLTLLFVPALYASWFRVKTP